MEPRRPSLSLVFMFVGFVAVVLLAGWCALRMAGVFGGDQEPAEGPYVDTPPPGHDAPRRGPTEEPRSP